MCADRRSMGHVVLRRGSRRFPLLAAFAFALALVLAACGNTTATANGTSTPKLPPLSSSIEYNGVSFSVPVGFIYNQVGPTGSPTTGNLLKHASNLDIGKCPTTPFWNTASVFFTSQQAIDYVNSQWSQSNGGKTLSVETGPVNIQRDCGLVYVTQHLRLPAVGLGMAIGGEGETVHAALALPLAIVDSAKKDPAST